MIFEKFQKGFTLIELLVVIAIISILLALTLTAFSGVQKTGRDGKRKTDLEQIRSALEMYRADNSTYPVALSSLVSTYIPAVPTDPQDYSYYYNRPTTSTYTLCAYLEGGGSDNCGSNCGAPGGANCNYKVIQP